MNTSAINQHHGVGVAMVIFVSALVVEEHAGAHVYATCQASATARQEV